MDNIFMIKWPALGEACHAAGLKNQFAAQEQWCTVQFTFSHEAQKDKDTLCMMHFSY